LQLTQKQNKMGLGSFFKNMFGSKKVDEVVDKIEDFADEAIAKAKESAAPLIDKVENFADQAEAKVKEYAPQASETINNIVETVKEKAEVFVDKAEHFAHDAVETVKEKVNSFTNDAPQATTAHEAAVEPVITPSPEKAADELAD
jgi:F0F1-type ATP synthase membrane subunit b/b'